MGLVGRDLPFSVLEGEALQPHIQAFKDADGGGKGPCEGLWGAWSAVSQGGDE